MSPRLKYYGALAAFPIIVLGMIITGPTSPLAFMAAWVVALCCIVYASFLARCPNCRTRLSEMLKPLVFSHGLPGRICPSCGHDLSKP
jgi:hypothetical protein